MNLKLALATLGVSLLAVSANAQTIATSVDPQQLNVPGILDYNGNYEFLTGGAAASLFVVPTQVNLVLGTGYTVDYTGIALGLFPLQVGDLGGGVMTGVLNQPVFSLEFDGTAVTTTGEVVYDLYDGDPFGAGVVVGTARAPFTALIPGANVPEPGTVALLIGMGVAGVTFRRRRK